MGIMIEARSGREWIVRLQDGEDLMKALRSLSDGSALILGGIGMLRDAELGYWNGEDYEVRAHAAPAELVSLQGNLAVNESGERVVHVHAVLFGQDGVAFGGHLVRGVVHNTVEMGFLPLEAVAMDRRPESSGLVGLYPRTQPR
jgi:uncharacterized protein